jgi:two-component system, LytTR family, response regulator
MFRVLVADDEPLARDLLVRLLRRDREVQAIVECEDGLSARRLIQESRPDIVFLDVEMPGADGLVLAGELPPDAPVVVFTTAFSQHAIAAFERAATDYVLKPFSDERFFDALDRAKRRVRERRLAELASEVAGAAGGLRQDGSRPVADAESPYLQRLSVRRNERSIVLPVGEIVWIEAQDYCVTIHSTRGSHLVRASLASLQKRLSPATFVRVHRTTIVNVHHVRETDERDGLRLVLSDGARVGVSRSRRSHVESLLSPRLR